MSDIVVYGIPGSPFMRSVQMGLEEKQAPYRIQAMGPGEAKSEAYLRKNPFGRVPLFEHGDFSLYETQAILRYLDDVFPQPPFEPSDPRQAARMNQIIGINDWYFFPKAAAVIVFNRIIGPTLLGTTTDEAAVAAAVPMARTCIAELDRLLGAQPIPCRRTAVDRRPDAGAAARFLRRDAGGQIVADEDAARSLARADQRAAEHAGDAAAGGVAARGVSRQEAANSNRHLPALGFAAWISKSGQRHE